VPKTGSILDRGRFAKQRRIIQRPNSAAGIAITDIGGIETVSVEGAAICNCRTANIRAATERGGA
jgi:hypothetical protein